MARKIVIFADGTGKTVGGRDSNVLRLCRMLDLSGRHDQVAIYDPGVGTLASKEKLRAQLPSPIQLIDDEAMRPAPLRWLELPFGLLGGAGTQRNIRRLYRKLACVYEPGDEVFVFGFSRGAFTARALAGIIYRCGVPRSQCIGEADQAIRLTRKHYEACRNSDDLRALKGKVEEFKRHHAHACSIRFLGVWDTVKSVGYLFPRNLPHTRHNPIIQTVRHALSLGERRSFYAPTTWGGLDGDTRPAIYQPAHLVGDAPPEIRRQDVQEVWFPGDHSDVGGGHDHEDKALADVSLQWMVNEAHHAGLRFDEGEYSKIKPEIGNLSASNVHDPMTDGLVSPVLWRLLEYCPRRDIDNEPPPPRLSMLWLNPLGPRVLEPSARQGVVTVHRAAERCYCEESAPWKNTRCIFTWTIERVKPITNAKVLPQNTPNS